MNKSSQRISDDRGDFQATDLNQFLKYLLARMMHEFSTAATKSSALPALHDPQAGAPGLLNVPYSTFAGASVARLVRSAFSSLRDKNLCIIRATSK